MSTADTVRYIWSEILGIRECDIQETDDFFALGGTSLRLMTMLTRVRAATGKKVKVSEFLTTDSLSDFCGIIDDKT